MKRVAPEHMLLSILAQCICILAPLYLFSGIYILAEPPRDAPTVPVSLIVEKPKAYRGRLLRITGMYGGGIFHSLCTGARAPGDFLIQDTNNVEQSLPIIVTEQVTGFLSPRSPLTIVGYLRWYDGPSACGEGNRKFWYIEPTELRAFQLRHLLLQWLPD